MGTSRRLRGRQALTVRLVQVMFFLAVAGLWYVATRSTGSRRLVLPRPGAVAEELVTLLQEAETYAEVGRTLREVLIAFGLAAASGLTVGIVAGSSRFWRSLVEPVLSALYAVPIVLAYPICVLVFGIGSASKVAFGALFAFFPVALHALRGAAEVDPALMTVARSAGASRWQQVLHVRARGALPSISTGLHVAAVLTYLAVVAGQLLVGTGGLGRRIGDSMETFQTPTAFAWIAIAIGVAFALSTATQAATQPWRWRLPWPRGRAPRGMPAST